MFEPRYFPFQSSSQKFGNKIQDVDDAGNSSSGESAADTKEASAAAEVPAVAVPHPPPSSLDEPNLDELLNLGGHNASIDTNDPIAAAVRY